MNKKTIYIKFSLFLILFTLFLSSVSANLLTGLDGYYTFDISSNNQPNNVSSTGNFTNNGAVYNPTGKMGGAYSFEGNDWMTRNNVISSNVLNKSFNFWFLMDNTANTDYMFYVDEGTSTNMYLLLDGNTFDWRHDAEIVRYQDIGDINTATLNPGEWYMMTLVYHAGTNLSIYLNGVLEGNDETGTSNVRTIGVGLLTLGSLTTHNNYFFNGDYDEFGIWNKTLTQTEITNLFGAGSGCAYPFTSCGGGGGGNSQTPTVAEVDPENEDTVTQLNLSVEFIGFNITNGVAALNYSGTVYTANNIIVDYGVGGNLSFGVNITTPITTINNTAQSYTWLYNLTHNASDIIEYSTAGTQNLLWNYPRINITRVYNAYTNATIENFTGNISLGASVYPFVSSDNFSLNPLPYGVGNYTLYVEAVGYAISNSTNYKTLEITNADNLSIYTAEFGLYSNNSVLVTVYNEDTLTVLNSNVTLTVTGNSSETITTFTGGTFLAENLIDGVYNFKFAATNFSQRSYTITVAENSFQNLAAYLTPDSFTVTLSFIDYDSSASLEGVAITMSRLINSSWSVVESKNSDITGRAQFYYLQNVKYRFYASLTGYTSKTFDLDPILFNSYTVTLNRIFVQDETIDYSGVSIGFSPKIYYNDVQNNFSIFFASPDGLFINYNYNATYPSGSIAGSGSNAVGENFLGDINITGAGFFDNVNISYCYNITVGADRCYNFIYAIHGAGAGNNTLWENQNNTYGMGIFERVLISTGIIILVAGTVALALGTIPAMAISLMLMGIFTYIGFYPLWLFLISALVGVVLIIKSGS